MVNVLLIVVTQAEELLYMLDAYQNRPLSDGLKLDWICTNGAGTNNVPKTQQITEERHISSVWHKDVCHEDAIGLYGDGQDGY